MIVGIQVYISSLLLALKSKFHFANILITPYIILRNVEHEHVTNWKQISGYVLVSA